MHLINIAPGHRTDITYSEENVTFSRVLGGELFTVNYLLHKKITLHEFNNLVTQATKMGNDMFKSLSDSLH